jgi:Acyclic terpene utilisation family protein AtuA
MDTAALGQVGRDRVSINGVIGRPPPNTTKVAITGLGAWRNSTTVVLTGLDVDGKAALFEDTVRSQLDADPGITDLRFTRIGKPDPDPEDQMAGSCLLQVAVDGEESSCGRAFSAFLVELALSSFPGIYYTELPGNGSPYGVYWPALIEQSVIDQVTVHGDGTRENIPAPTHPEHTGQHSDPPSSAPQVDLVSSDGDSYVDAPLGAIAQARSGDKGGNANVGIWVQTAAAWPWLQSTLTIDQFKQLVPEAEDLEVDRFELANLNAINFVVHGLLDGGATEARRFDKQAKALGEYLRSRYLRIPSRLLEPGSLRD